MILLKNFFIVPISIVLDRKVKQTSSPSLVAGLKGRLFFIQLFCKRVLTLKGNNKHAFINVVGAVGQVCPTYFVSARNPHLGLLAVWADVTPPSQDVLAPYGRLHTSQNLRLGFSLRSDSFAFLLVLGGYAQPTTG